MSENKTIVVKDSNTLMDRLNRFLMRDSSFILIIMGAAAAIFAGTFMYVSFGTGALNDIAVVQLLTDGLSSGDYSGAVGFASGFLIARILEGPLVGVLDIGGSLMTGVGIGIPALMLQTGFKLPMDNFLFALITGALIGLVIGLIIMGVRKSMPEGVAVGGTEIMMGAGNASGRYLGPLIIIAAAQFNPFAGIGAIIGAAIFYKWDKEMTGGAILGAMALGMIFIG